MAEQPVVSPPLSPHLQIWRWTVTMATSILQRATGIAMYAGTLLLTIWIAAAAMGPETYNQVMAIYASPFGIFVLFGYSWAICYHMLGGIRFLFWDAGYGFSKEKATLTAWLVIAGSLLLTGIIWASAYSAGGGQ